MKKFLSIALVTLSMFSMVACSSSSSSTTTESTTTESSSASSSSTTTAATTEESYTLSLNHVGATTHPYHDGSLMFAELVESYSNGSITVDVFPSSQIASGTTAIEYVQMGTLDIALESTMSLSNFVTEIGVLDMPFMFASRDEAYAALDGEAGAVLEAAAEAQGFKILGWWDNGFRSIVSTKGIITSPDDMAGLKIRTPESAIFIATFEALGCLPTPTAVSEVFSALQLGTVDASENSDSNNLNNKYTEVADYYTVSKHMYTAEPLLMSLEKFNSFSEAQQEAIMQAASEAGAYQRELAIALDEDIMDQIAATGVEMYYVEDLTPFKDAVAGVYDMFEDEFGDLYDIIEACKTA